MADPIAKPAASASVGGSVSVPPPPAPEVKDQKPADAPAPAPAADSFGYGEKYRLKLFADISAARLGGNGTALSPQFAPANEGYDHTVKRFGVGVGMNLLNPTSRFQLWVDGIVGYRNLSGNVDSPGEMHGAFLGVDLCAGYSQFGSSIIYGPELCGYASALYMNGDSTAGNNFSVDKTKGFGYNLGALLSPVRVKIGNGLLVPYANVEAAQNGTRDNTVDGPVKAPTLAFGGGAAIVWSWDKTVLPPTDRTICTVDQMQLEQKVEALRDLRAGLEAKYKEFKTFTDLLKKEFKTENIRDALRLGYVRSHVMAETTKLKEANPKITQKELDAALKPLEAKFTEEAKKEFADDYDHYTLTWPVQKADIESFNPNEKDKTCVKTNGLYQAVMDDMSRLEYFRGVLEERLKPIFVAVGSPPQIITRIQERMSLALQFPPILFASNRPNEIDIARIEKANLTNVKGPDDPDLRKAFQGVFMGTNELKKLYRVAQALKGEVDPPNVNTKGMSEEAGKQLRADMAALNILIEGHTSKSGSKDGSETDPMVKLSQRRSDAIRLALIAYGVPAERLRAQGYGFTRPLDDSDTGNEASAAAVTNRRTIFVIDTKKKATPDAKADAPKEVKGETPEKK